MFDFENILRVRGYALLLPTFVTTNNHVSKLWTLGSQITIVCVLITVSRSHTKILLDKIKTSQPYSQAEESLYL